MSKLDIDGGAERDTPKLSEGAHILELVSAVHDEGHEVGEYVSFIFKIKASQDIETFPRGSSVRVQVNGLDSHDSYVRGKRLGQLRNILQAVAGLPQDAEVNDVLDQVLEGKFDGSAIRSLVEQFTTRKGNKQYTYHCTPHKA